MENLKSRLSQSHLVRPAEKRKVKSSTTRMELLLVRDILLKERTLGRLSINGVHECFICEDPVRADGVKIKGNTAIPAGRYEIIITLSPRFKRELPLLLNVPNFEGIRIHSGNHEEHTEGCLLPGTTRTEAGVFNSNIATNALILKIRSALNSGKKVFITIQNGSVA